MRRTLVTLAGGVGAARFLQGLVNLFDQENLTVIVNTCDDFELHGLHISPDLDIIVYTLAGIVNEETGWGVKGDTFNFLEMLASYGADTWFKIGDKDLATHIWRTERLRNKFTLSQVTKEMCKLLGVKTQVLPMTDNRVVAKVAIGDRSIHFEEYYVKEQYRQEVDRVFLEGVDDAKPAPGVVESIRGAGGVIVAPSNPIVSIGTILSIAGVREALRETGARVVAISPLIAGMPVKGPADKLMKSAGLEVSSYGVTRFYQDFIDVIVIDEKDRALTALIEGLGIRVVSTNTLMKTAEDKLRLARITLQSLGLVE